MQQQSYLQFVASALGPKYAILLVLATAVALAIVAAMLIRGRGAWAVGAVLLAVPLPLLVGLYAFVDGSLSSFLVIAHSAVQPKPAEWAAGLATALVGINLGMLLTALVMLAAIFGLAIRAFIEPKAEGHSVAFTPPHLPQRAPAKAV